MKKTILGIGLILTFLAVFLTFEPFFIFLACWVFIYLFWSFIFQKKVGWPLYLLLLFALLVSTVSLKIYLREKKGMIQSVAPYSFLDIGDEVEIKGGWNFSETKHESTVIYCNKNVMTCGDFTARLVFKGHLHIAPVLWKVANWEDGFIIAECANFSLYQESLLYIDRKDKRAFIIAKEDYLANEKFIIQEKLQDTFYDKIGKDK